MTSDVNAWTIQKTLMRERFRRSFVLPNYTPARWWECDVFQVTSAGYFVEYEVKLTVSDFKADAKKRDDGWHWDAQRHRIHDNPTRKHELLAEGSHRGPSRFFFVTTPGLVALEHRENLDSAAVVPPWAGLIEVDHPERKPTPRAKVVRKAPRLHSEKVSDKIAAHARGICYWRMHRCLLEVRS